MLPSALALRLAFGWGLLDPLRTAIGATIVVAVAAIAEGLTRVLRLGILNVKAAFGVLVAI